ncbi:PD40 domain-containing protein [Candidatus Berkelbacteria bacterium]|nr:PD40 domain-containing protein [Candidatus Berkelbacteria bacterium]
MKNTRIWLLSGLVLLLIGGVIFFLFFWKATLSVSPTPAEAQVSVGDALGIGSLTTKLSPGESKVMVSLLGYLPYTQILELKTNEKRSLEIELRKLPIPQELIGDRIQYLALDAERESLLYLNGGTKTIERLFLENLLEPRHDSITPARFGGITEFVWSPNRQLAFFREGDALKQYDFHRYDLTNQTTKDWPTGIGSIDWRPDGEKVAYYYEPGGGEKSLIRANKDNGELERIFNFQSTDISNPTLFWSPDGKKIAILTQKLYIFDVFSKSLAELQTNGSVKEARWLPTSDRLLYQENNGRLTVINLENQRTELSLNGSVADCAFFADGSALVHASGSGQIAEFIKVAFDNSVQTPYLFDAAITELAPTNLLLAPDEKTLFFTSNGKLYALALDDGIYASGGQ